MNEETFLLTCTIMPLGISASWPSIHSIVYSGNDEYVFVDFPRGKRRNDIDCLRPRRKCLSQREAEHSRRVSRIEFVILKQVGFQMQLTNRKWQAGRRVECAKNRSWNETLVDSSRSHFYIHVRIKPVSY